MKWDLFFFGLAYCAAFIGFVGAIVVLITSAVGARFWIPTRWFATGLLVLGAFGVAFAVGLS